MFLVVAAKQKHMSPYTSSSVCYMLDENTLKSVQRLQNICTLDARKYICYIRSLVSRVSGVIKQ